MDSFFHVKLKGGDELHEKFSNWQDVSENKRVGYMGGTKTVFLCKHDIETIHVEHEGQKVDINVPAGHSVYQAVRSETLFTPGIGKTDRVIGRVVGLVKDGEIVEEYFINGIQRSVLGFRK